MVQRRKPSTLAGVTAAAILALLMTIPAHAQVTQEFHKTVPLSADGRVSLSNINGDVEITGWNKNEVQIDAVKTARDQQRLDEARIEVNANSSSVKIETHYPSHITNNNPASVHYTLHVPQNARLDKIDLVNGVARCPAGQRRSECRSGERQAARLRPGGYGRSGNRERHHRCQLHLAE